MVIHLTSYEESSLGEEPTNAFLEECAEEVEGLKTPKRAAAYYKAARACIVEGKNMSEFLPKPKSPKVVEMPKGPAQKEHNYKEGESYVIHHLPSKSQIVAVFTEKPTPGFIDPKGKHIPFELLQEDVAIRPSAQREINYLVDEDGQAREIYKVSTKGNRSTWGYKK